MSCHAVTWAAVTWAANLPHMQVTTIVSAPDRLYVTKQRGLRDTGRVLFTPTIAACRSCVFHYALCSDFVRSNCCCVAACKTWALCWLVKVRKCASAVTSPCAYRPGPLPCSTGGNTDSVQHKNVMDPAIYLDSADIYRGDDSFLRGSPQLPKSYCMDAYEVGIV